MLPDVVVIEKHQHTLEDLRLDTLAGVKQFNGELIKNHRGRRDIFRISTRTPAGQPLTLFLKRNWKPYKKDGITSFLRQGKVQSVAQQEWENSKALRQAGFQVAEPVAYGDDKGPFWEHFSFLITAAAPGVSLEVLLARCRDGKQRRGILDALAREIRKLHDAGLATPDLFARHIFVEDAAHLPRFCFIDMARLNRSARISKRTRARDLAALNASVRMQFASVRERLEFLRRYAGRVDRGLVRAIAARMRHLLQRGKFRDFHLLAPNA